MGLLPSSIEKYIDDFVEGQGESMLKGVFVLIGAKVLAIPVASTISSLFHVDAAGIEGWSQVGAAAVALWIVHFVHEHFFNGNVETPATTVTTSVTIPNAPAPTESQTPSAK